MLGLLASVLFVSVGGFFIGIGSGSVFIEIEVGDLTAGVGVLALDWWCRFCIELESLRKCLFCSAKLLNEVNVGLVVLGCEAIAPVVSWRSAERCLT